AHLILDVETMELVAFLSRNARCQWFVVNSWNKPPQKVSVLMPCRQPMHRQHRLPLMPNRPALEVTPFHSILYVRDVKSRKSDFFALFSLFKFKIASITIFYALQIKNCPHHLEGKIKLSLFTFSVFSRCFL